MPKRLTKFRLGVMALVVVIVGVGGWILSRPAYPLVGEVSKFYGPKVGDPNRLGPGPEVTIVAPSGGSSIRRSQVVDFVTRLKIAPGGELPTALLVFIERDGEKFGSSYPSAIPQEDGTFLCRWSMNAPPRPGRWRLHAQCQDWVKPGYFSSPREMVIRVTTEATADVVVE